jgi:magnesium transporter
MKEFHKIKDGLLVVGDPANAEVVSYTAPDENEKKQLLETLQWDEHDLESALDPDELSRVDFDPEYLFIIWKRPDNVSFEKQLKFEVSSAGLYLKGGKLTFIAREDGIPVTGKEFRKISSLNGVILSFFLNTVHHYLGHLRAIRRINAELQEKLTTSLENRYLLQMFNLGESLIYYITAIEENTSVLTKLRDNGTKIGLSETETEMLNDIIIEYQQCLRQAEMYSSVLSGLLDARGNIVNNNMNVLLKNLTLVNVVFLPLAVIAGIGGMSEFSMMTKNIPWPIAYLAFILGLAGIGFGTWILLKRYVDRSKSEK